MNYDNSREEIKKKRKIKYRCVLCDKFYYGELKGFYISYNTGETSDYVKFKLCDKCSCFAEKEIITFIKKINKYKDK